MRQLWAALMTVESTDRDTQRRGRNVVGAALGLVGTALAIALSDLVKPLPVAGMATVLLGALIFAGCAVMARRGQVTLSGLVLLGSVLLALVIEPVLVNDLALAPFYLAIPVVLAGGMLRPRALVGLLAVTALAFAFLAVRFKDAGPLVGVDTPQLFVLSGILVGFLGLLAALNAQSNRAALAQAEASRQAAEESRAALDQANQALEGHVATRTAELNAALATQAAQAQELSAALVAQRDLNAVVAELALPIIPVRDDVLVVPLVGALDAARINTLAQRVLAAIEQQRARVVILDITGVPAIDHAVAQGLLATAAAARLLGARPMLVGVRPDVADALTVSGIDLTALDVAATLQEALTRLSR